MFESLKLYKEEAVDLEEVHGRLVDFGYSRQPKDAEMRLKAIEEHTELGSGFKIVRDTIAGLQKDLPT